jgi:hypothetical protein
MRLDEDTWNTATNSNPEMKAWVDEIQTIARLQAADCTTARTASGSSPIPA